MTITAQLLGIERGNPWGVLVLSVLTLIGLGWMIYYYPQGRAAKALIEMRQDFEDWARKERAARKDMQEQYRDLWDRHVALMKRCEELEGKLARLEAKYANGG